MTSVLEVSGLNVRFQAAGQAVHAVRGVSYSLAPGEVLGIVGESGSGKTASSLAVMGLLPPSASVTGSVRLRGREILGLGDRALAEERGKTIAMIFQDPLSALTPVYPVGRQIAETVRIHTRVSGPRAAARAVELLDLVGIPDPRRRAKAFPHEFSGGMRQRVMIAMAIANDPDVLIADEPTTALDVTIQAQVLEVLKTAQRETGAAVVMITHDLGVVAGIADRVLVMYAGRPVEFGSVDDVFYRPRMPYTMGLLGALPRPDREASASLVPIEGNPPSPAGLPPGCPFAPRCPLVIDECRSEEPPLRPVGGHEAACVRAGEIERDGLTGDRIFPVPSPVRPTVAPDAGPILEVEGLIRHYRAGAVRAVDGISFAVRRGETLGLVGESGSGKSTTLQAIMELRAPQAGRVVVLGADTGSMSRAERRRCRADLQIVFQDPMAALDPRMPIADIVAEPLRAHGRSDVRERVAELLDLVGLEPAHAARYPQALSGGQRQRVGIARALALEPKLIVLDEPVSALDVSIRAGVINLLLELKGRLALSYLFVAHDLSVVRHVADRVAVMYLGRIVEIGPVADVYDRPAHPYTRALLSAVPVPDPGEERARRRIILPGDPPSPSDPPSGCRFRTRCPLHAELGEEDARRCDLEEPGIAEDHGAACHYVWRSS